MEPLQIFLTGPKICLLIPKHAESLIKTKIYALLNQYGQIRYIGKTVQTLNQRLNRHISSAKKPKGNHRCNWIKSMLSEHISPTIMLIGEVSGNGNAEEISWISYGKEEKWPLTNSTSGGDGSYIGQKRKSMAGKNNPMYGKVAWNKGKECSEETKQKLSRELKGRPKSEEFKKKVSLTLTGKTNHWKGKKRSEESNNKTSLSLMGHRSWSKGQKLTEETKIKMRGRIPWNKGTHLSDSYKQKISLGGKGKHLPPKWLFGKKWDQNCKTF
jgi:hypothetical protein